MQTNQATLQLLAEAVADGSEVDWQSAEAGAQNDDERAVIRQLQGLAMVGLAARAQASSWGALQLRGVVGEGSFGTVYRAWDPGLEREVALKLLNTDQARQPVASTIVREGRLLAKITHPNVVAVYGADAHDGRSGIWMELVNGRTLKEIVKEQGPFGAQEAALIGRDLCRALAAVHRQGFLHRDVKAQNVMREAGGRTVLMDFGAGEAIPSSDALSAVAEGGTPLYLAPELLEGAAPSLRSDVYSLGVLLYFLASGEFPVVGESLKEIRELHANGRQRRLRDVRPDLAPAFVRAVDACVAPLPADRPESTGAVDALLERALGLDEPPVVTGNGTSGGRLSKGGRRALAGWRLVAVVTAMLLLPAMGWLFRDRTGRASAAIGRNSVAILPFRNLSSAGQQDDYLSDGMASDLAARLATLRDVRVIGGASTERYKDRTKTDIEIGAELGVATVLDGSVRLSGDRVRIISQLLDAGTGEQLWSDVFERDLKDIVPMQSEVARKIAVALKGALSAPDIERFASDRSRNSEAFNLYLKGRYFAALRTEDGLNRGVQYFNEAIARDPSYAAAYAGLAEAYTAFGTYGILPRLDVFARAADAARKAVSLDDSLAESHAALGYAEKNQFKWALAEASFKRAIELNPNYGTAHHWYSIFLTQQGRFPEAITEIKTAISLDPQSIGANLQLASVLLLARRYSDAVQQFDFCIRMDAGVPFAYRSLGQAYTYQGQYERALMAFDQAVRVTPAPAEDQELKAALGYLYALSGRKADALAIARELADRYRGTGEEVGASIAAIYAALGQTDTAFMWLTGAVAVRDDEVGYLKVDPRWDSLRGDARFDSLLATLGLTR